MKHKSSIKYSQNSKKYAELESNRFNFQFIVNRGIEVQVHPQENKQSQKTRHFTKQLTKFLQQVNVTRNKKLF